MEGDPMVIVLKPGSVTPSRCPPSRAVPIHLESEAEDEINKYLKMGRYRTSHSSNGVDIARLLYQKAARRRTTGYRLFEIKPVRVKAGTPVSEPGGDPSVDPGILQSFCQVRL